jgi:lipoprotein-anchoring transpeptidase ErfK/SrfK
VFFKKCWLSRPDLGILGGDMSKRAKRGKTETLVLPVAGKVAVVVIAVAALGYGLLSHPASVQPVRKPAPAPAPARASVPAPALAAASQVEIQKTADVPGRLARQVVDYVSHEAPGTVVIDTGNTFLYLVLNPRQAMRYGIGVGREGFTWSGEQAVARKTEWPDWRPPADMLSRQPYLPRFMAGGPGNPLGARAMYLGETEYRIHGTNKPDTIGKQVSSGCIRLTNEDVADLYERVKIGTKVIVLPITLPNPATHRPNQGPPAGADATLHLPDPASPANRPST